MQRGEDVDGPSVLGRDAGYAVRGRLDDGEAKGLLEGDVDEDAARGVREAVDVGDVRLREEKFFFLVF